MYFKNQNQSLNQIILMQKKSKSNQF